MNVESNSYRFRSKFVACLKFSRIRSIQTSGLRDEQTFYTLNCVFFVFTQTKTFQLEQAMKNFCRRVGWINTEITNVGPGYRHLRNLLI